MDQGANVTDAGMCSTDALQYASWAGGYDLSLMVTASHNPGEFNGTKLVKSDGLSIGQATGLNRIKRMVLRGKFPATRRKGGIDRTEVLGPFVKHALSFIKPRRLKPFKIVVDAGNGMGGALIELLAKHVPFRIVPMYFKPDGSFPNHDADPTRPECARVLRNRVRQEKADLGLGFDGDADRAVFIDDRGQGINGSELGSVMTEKLLEESPGAKIGSCLVSSWIARDTVNAKDGTHVPLPVGGANIRPRMRRQDIVFVSERSGHFYMAANNLGDSGLITALMVLERLSLAGCSLSELITPYRKYYMAPELTILVGTDRSTLAQLKQIKDRKAARVEKLARGARVVRGGKDKRYEFDDWWFCVRPSGTNPRQLRMTVEARSKKLMREKYEELKRLLVG